MTRGYRGLTKGVDYPLVTKGLHKVTSFDNGSTVLVRKAWLLTR